MIECQKKNHRRLQETMGAAACEGRMINMKSGG